MLENRSYLIESKKSASGLKANSPVFTPVPKMFVLVPLIPMMSQPAPASTIEPVQKPNLSRASRFSAIANPPATYASKAKVSSDVGKAKVSLDVGKAKVSSDASKSAQGKAKVSLDAIKSAQGKAKVSPTPTPSGGRNEFTWLASRRPDLTSAPPAGLAARNRKRLYKFASMSAPANTEPAKFHPRSTHMTRVYMPPKRYGPLSLPSSESEMTKSEYIAATLNPLCWKATQARLETTDSGAYVVPHTSAQECGTQPMMTNSLIQGKIKLQMEATLKMRRMPLIDRAVTHEYDCGHAQYGALLRPTDRYSHCMICHLLPPDVGERLEITSEATSYATGQTSHVFVCGRGHRFVAVSRINECATCALETAVSTRFGTIAMSADCGSLHARTTTRLRWQCLRAQHDSKCDDPACARWARVHGEPMTGCKSIKICGCDFYATAHQIFSGDWSAFDCASAHNWRRNGEVLYTVRVFETIYNRRFDDSTREMGFESTGYNAEAGIVYTHENDVIANICAGIAREWCTEHALIFILVPASMAGKRPILEHIVRNVPKPTGFVVETWTRELRKQMLEDDRQGRPFADRCIW